MLSNMMGYTSKAANVFTDVPSGAWYEDAMLKLMAAGVIQGNGDGTANPNGPITREQTAVMLCRAFDIQPSRNASLTYNDSASISSWARDAMAALAERGMMNGVGDNTAAPLANINRASVATLADNMIAEYVTESKTITGKVDGIILVAGGVSVNLDNATVSQPVIVATKASGVNVNLTGATSAENIVVEAGGAKVNVGAEASASSVVSSAPNADVTVSGKVDSVEVTGSNNTVSVSGTVGTVTAEAPNTNVTVSGTVNNVDIGSSASRSNVTVTASGKVDSVATDASNVSVSGNGTVGSVTSTGGSVDVTTKGTEVNNQGGNATASGKNVGSGESATSTGTSGGSSSGSSSSSDSGYDYGDSNTGNSGNTGDSNTNTGNNKTAATVSSEAIELKVGETKDFTVTTDAASISVTSSSEAVATVAQKTGAQNTQENTTIYTVTGVSEGTANVTVTADVGSTYTALSKTVTVSVKPADSPETPGGDKKISVIEVTLLGDIEQLYVNDPLPAATLKSVTPTGSVTVAENKGTVWKNSTSNEVQAFATAGTYTATITLEITEGFTLDDSVTCTVDGNTVKGVLDETATPDTFTLTVTKTVSKRDPGVTLNGEPFAGDNQDNPIMLSADESATDSHTVQLTVTAGGTVSATPTKTDESAVVSTSTDGGTDGKTTVTITGKNKGTDTVTITADGNNEYNALSMQVYVSVSAPGEVASVAIVMPEEISTKAEKLFDISDSTQYVTVIPAGSATVTVKWADAAGKEVVGGTLNNPAAGTEYVGTFTVTPAEYNSPDAKYDLTSTTFTVNGKKSEPNSKNNENGSVELSEKVKITAKTAIDSVAVKLPENAEEKLVLPGTNSSDGVTLPTPVVTVDDTEDNGTKVTVTVAWKDSEGQAVAGGKATKPGEYTGTITVAAGENHMLTESTTYYVGSTEPTSYSPNEGGGVKLAGTLKVTVKQEVASVTITLPDDKKELALPNGSTDGVALPTTTDLTVEAKAGSVTADAVTVTVAWKDNSGNAVMDGKATKSGSYVGTVTVKAKEGSLYVLTETTKYTVDGKDEGTKLKPGDDGSVELTGTLKVAVKAAVKPISGVTATFAEGNDELTITATKTGTEKTALYYYLVEAKPDLAKWTDDLTMEAVEKKEGSLLKVEGKPFETNKPIDLFGLELTGGKTYYVVVVEYAVENDGGEAKNESKVVAVGAATEPFVYKAPVSVGGDLKLKIDKDSEDDEKTGFTVTVKGVTAGTETRHFTGYLVTSAENEPEIKNLLAVGMTEDKVLEKLKTDEKEATEVTFENGVGNLSISEQTGETVYIVVVEYDAGSNGKVKDAVCQALKATTAETLDVTAEKKGIVSQSLLQPKA